MLFAWDLTCKKKKEEEENRKDNNAPSKNTEAAGDSVMKERTKPRNIQTYIKLICIAAEMPHISPEVIA